MADIFTSPRGSLGRQATQYAFALLALAISTAIRVSLDPVLGDRLPYLFFFVAVAVISLTCDLYPALVVLLGTTLAANYLFLPPHYQFTLSGEAFAFGSLYLLSGSGIVYVGQRHRRSAEALKEQREWLHTTLISIGDAVIATDAEGRITLMNPVAETLTGWAMAEARGKSLSEVFRIINQETREPVENPVDKVRRLKRVVGLANHTILIDKRGREIAIDDSGAPIFDAHGSTHRHRPRIPGCYAAAGAGSRVTVERKNGSRWPSLRLHCS
jgi:PAS domain S-box-containing protein